MGARIRTRRLLHSWSVRFAAGRAGISHATWSRIERGLLLTAERLAPQHVRTSAYVRRTTGDLLERSGSRELRALHSRLT